MAIHFLNVGSVRRSEGRSVISAAAYCARSRLKDTKTLREVDFSAGNDLIHSEILLPLGADARWAEREILWNEVEAVETRSNAQLALEIEAALPDDLPAGDEVGLCREFVTPLFVERGRVVDVNLHRAVGADGHTRVYLHALLSMREIGSDGFGKKLDDWHGPKLLMQWRERWAILSNKYLLAAGRDRLIRAGADAVRGRGLEPLFDDAESERLAENYEIAWRNGERLLGEPDLALRALTNASATFSHREMIAFVSKNTAGKEQFETARARVECSVELVRLADGESFSTRSLVATVQCAPSQRGAVAMASGGLDATETSQTLEEAISQWERAGLRLRGVGLTYETAKAFEKKSGIKSVGVHGLLGRWKKKQDRLASTDVLVVNDAKGLSARQKEWMLRATRAARAKLVLVDGTRLVEIDGGATGLSPEEMTAVSC
ncbi:MobA/MobL family protein [Methylosinus sp. Sm6]|uniref:MobA/MobL family protein n=1 Tax=Methylosinus sp. Sm6 TaxID=2866948 RepID=UPI0021033160|nr:MobA/MobL family protein [Methylosinus sp. Sm6]